MSLKTKTILTFLILFISINVSLYVFAKYILFDNLSKLEKEETKQRVISLVRNLDSYLDDLYSSVLSIVSQENILLFINSKDETYLKRTDINKEIKSLHLSFFLITDRRGNILYSKYNGYRSGQSHYKRIYISREIG